MHQQAYISILITGKHRAMRNFHYICHITSLTHKTISNMIIKKLLLFMAATGVTLCAHAWKPIFVGHRGGYTGVQNTTEAYTNGVEKYGYAGLECDVRVTADGKYVISHDESTSSLGGSLTVASATLEQLKAETLTQTRGGVTYTGKICTVEEYLDICAAKGVIPVIELKWTTGINNNDMSNFAGLATLVKTKNLDSKAVFLTSMKQSIEYIRTNYPELNCQFLTGEYWANHFDWCVKWKVNASIQAGYFDIHTVKKFHDAGLQVAVWTVNSEADYTKYGNMGVYMMTCDYLYPSKMPEIADINWDSIPDKVDPIEIESSTTYKFSDADGTLPANFPISNSSKSTYTTGQQAAWSGGRFYVNNYGTSTLVAYDATGQVTTDLKGTNSHGIAADDAGNLILRNDGITATPSKLKIYKKGSTEATDIEFSLTNAGQTNFISASGDVLSAEGGYVYFFPNKQTVVNVVKIANGEPAGVTTSGTLSLTGSTAGYVIPVGNDPDNFIYQVRNKGYYRYNGKDLGAFLAGTGSTTAPNRNNSVGGAFFSLGGHDLLVHCSGTNYNGGFTVRDMSADGAALLTMPALGTVGYTDGNVSCGSFFAVERVDDNCVNLYEYCMAGGYAAYTLRVKGSITGVTSTVTDRCELNAWPSITPDVTTLHGNAPIRAIDVRTIAGTTVMHANGSGETSATVSLAGLPSGMYLITTDANATVRVIKR